MKIGKLLGKVGKAVLGSTPAGQVAGKVLGALEGGGSKAGKKGDQKAKWSNTDHKAFNVYRQQNPEGTRESFQALSVEQKKPFYAQAAQTTGIQGGKETFTPSVELMQSQAPGKSENSLDTVVGGLLSAFS